MKQTSLLQQESKNNNKLVSYDPNSASAEDISAGNFEIKCSTSCDFVKKNSENAVLMHSATEAAMDAAEELAKAQDDLESGNIIVIYLVFFFLI